MRSFLAALRRHNAPEKPQPQEKEKVKQRLEEIERKIAIQRRLDLLQRNK